MRTSLDAVNRLLSPPWQKHMEFLKSEIENHFAEKARTRNKSGPPDSTLPGLTKESVDVAPLPLSDKSSNKFSSGKSQSYLDSEKRKLLRGVLDTVVDEVLGGVVSRWEQIAEPAGPDKEQERPQDAKRKETGDDPAEGPGREDAVEEFQIDKASLAPQPIQYDLELTEFTVPENPPCYSSLPPHIAVEFPPSTDGWSVKCEGKLSGEFNKEILNKKYRIVVTFQGDNHVLHLHKVRGVGQLMFHDISQKLPRAKDARASVHFNLNYRGSVSFQIRKNSASESVNETDKNLFSRGFRVGKMSLRANLDLGLQPEPTLGIAATLKIGYLSLPLRFSLDSLAELKNPSVDFFTKEIQRLAQELKDGNIPRRWGRSVPAGPPPIPLTDLYRRLSEQESDIARGIRGHGPCIIKNNQAIFPPYRIIFDTSYDSGGHQSLYGGMDHDPMQPTFPPSAPTRMHGERDSAIWTGHLLAAEALRYNLARGSGESPSNPVELAAALAQANEVLSGIEKLFEIPAAIHPEQLTGLICRAALPQGAVQPGISFEAPPSDIANEYYGPVNLNDPDYPVWYGFSRDTDPPSRDSYIGVIFGLAMAYRLIDDIGIRQRTGTLITQAITFLYNDNGWTIPTPTGKTIERDPASGRIKTRIETSYFHNFYQQLALLRVGKTVNQELFGKAYDDVAAAAEHMWIAIWPACVEPLEGYFKFNLQQASFTLLMQFEDNPEIRGHYLRAYTMVRQVVGSHQNAYFDMLWILALRNHEHSNPRLPSVAETKDTSVQFSEIAASMYGLLERQENLHGPNCLPLRRTPDPQYMVNQYLYRKLRKYRPLLQPESHTEWMNTFSMLPQKRTGWIHDDVMDFFWQRDPFRTYLKVDEAGQALDVAMGFDRFPNVDPCWPRPREEAGLCTKRDIVIENGERVISINEDKHVEATGVDFLLAYRLGRYLGLWPAV